tara:strand:- start:177 stop:875 length:699 start_codon:yes stop_codon:yes gene_type:complete
MTIQKKLSEIQQNLKAPKGQRNNFGKYDFRSCEDILKAVKPFLGDLSLTLSDELVFSGMLEDEIVAAGVTVKTQRVYIKATATLSSGTDTITATAYAREASVKKGMDSSQLTGSTSSYARKYCLAGLFSIDSEADSDATNKYDEDKTVVIDMTNDSDMSLEGMAGQPAAGPAKRVSKKLVQDVVALVNSSQETNETSLLVEALGELDQNEKQVIWKQLTGNQQEFVRLTKEM